MEYPKDLRAITIHNPFCLDIGMGVKPLEFRSWDTKHRGLTLLHVGSNRSYEKEFAEAYPNITKESIDAMRGAIIGFAEIIDSFWSQEDSCYAHRIANPGLFRDTCPCPGALNYWKPQAKRKAEQEWAFQTAWDTIQKGEFDRPDPELIRESEIAYGLKPLKAG
ncbi:ASCH domain-containing protein [Leptothoe kymatousa]|uniref:ASCH domain-containing protein n=1 Tax=Leptothoe kymatousa TAU-MAC 1615 TaxID=2364775 RepID=A0ABS5Y3Y2_9CYAN|nr:hypothetical protein [Leptothoe kymatousa]MBT9312548.1 hypothetical protein [Leptothoe kymatousa TAU-MAC 1615]